MAGNFLGVAVSGLEAAQTALSTISNNVSNVNTPGYSVESTNLVTQQPQFAGSSYIGTGVSVQSVTRTASELVNQQLRNSTSNMQGLQTLYSTALPIDTILSSQQTGLTTGIDSFYSALQTAVDDPGDISSRTAFISQAQNLTAQFATLSNQLDQSTQSITEGINSALQDINSNIQNLTKVNQQISASGNNPAPTLLDSRDEILQQLSNDVGISVTIQPDQTASVFMGSGQSLVVGGTGATLKTVLGTTDPQIPDIAIANGSNSTVIPSNTITGGTLGGLLNIQANIINPTQQSLGLVALGLQSSFNQQSALGIDLNGNQGGDFFNDINSPNLTVERATSATNNKGTAQLSVSINNVGQLTGDNYLLTFNNATSYTLQDLTTGKSTTLSSIASPIDGFTVNVDSGAMSSGDSFEISPTANAASTITVQNTNPSALALADPTITSANVQNSGTGQISQSQTVNVNTSAFAVPGQLSPPVEIQFLSPTSYQVLNASTGAAIQAGPIPYAPSQTNAIFPVPAMQVGTPSALVASGSLAPLATGDLTINGVAIPASAGDGVSTTDASASALAIATAINSQSTVTGVNATVSPNNLNLGTYTPGALVAGNFAINGQNIIVGAGTQNALINQINTLTGTTGVTASVDSSNNIILTANDGRNIEVSNTLVTGVGGAAFSNFNMQAATADDVQQGQVTLSDATGNMTIGGAHPNHAEMVAGVNDFFDPGYRASISGSPATGDTFNVNFNSNGQSDARNGILMAQTQINNIMENGTTTLNGVYGAASNSVANIVHQANLQAQSATSLNTQITDQQQSISGVDLDQEAADLLKFQDAYHANAEVIQATSTLINTLFAAIQ